MTVLELIEILSGYANQGHGEDAVVVSDGFITLYEIQAIFPSVHASGCMMVEVEEYGEDDIDPNEDAEDDDDGNGSEGGCSGSVPAYIG